MGKELLALVEKLSRQLRDAVINVEAERAAKNKAKRARPHNGIGKAELYAHGVRDGIAETLASLKGTNPDDEIHDVEDNLNYGDAEDGEDIL